MNNFLYGPQNVNIFIEFHKNHHVKYCETIIYPNGDVEYCIPSHQEILLRVCNMSKEEFSKRIFSWDETIIELCNESKCIATWYNAYINPKEITDKQFEALRLLRNNDCINSSLLLTKESGYQTMRSDCCD